MTIKSPNSGRRDRKDKGIPRAWRRDQILRALARFVVIHGVVSRDRYRVLSRGAGYPGMNTILRAYGSYRTALFLSGVHDRTWSRWIPEDDDFLRERAGTMSIRTMARRLGRTRVAIWQRMSLLGLMHRDNDGRYTATELARELGLCLPTVVRRVHSGLYTGQKIAGRWRITDPREDNWHGTDEAA